MAWLYVSWGEVPRPDRVVVLRPRAVPPQGRSLAGGDGEELVTPFVKFP